MPGMSLFHRLHFLTSAHDLRDLPPPQGAEIAFAGRSNAGKSSAINLLANHNRLAFVSKTPGRTQLINFFRLDDDRFLVDLPGYGYAKAPEATRRHWQHTLSAYLSSRSALCGLVLIMDARHPLTLLDRQMLDWFTPTGRPVHILLSKADKLSRQQALKTLRTVEETLQRTYPNCTAQLFSSLKRSGAEQARTVIAAWLGLTDTAPSSSHKKPPVKGE